MSARQRISYRLTRLVCIWVDTGYQGEGFRKWVMDTYRWILEVMRRPTDTKSFVLLPRRWVVERSNGRVQLVSSPEFGLRDFTADP